MRDESRIEKDEKDKRLGHSITGTSAGWSKTPFTSSHHRLLCLETPAFSPLSLSLFLAYFAAYLAVSLASFWKGFQGPCLHRI